MISLNSQNLGMEVHEFLQFREKNYSRSLGNNVGF